MTIQVACSRCGGFLPTGARFCPSCGNAAAPEPADWLDRLCAAGVDSAILAAASLLFVRLGAKWWAVLLVWLVLVEIGYHLRGSIGKTITHLNVLITSRWQYYLRETVGKLASAATFGIGFIMVFGNERLALHDYIARTTVVRTVSRPRVQQAMISASLMAALALFGYFMTRVGKTSGPLPVTGPQEAFSLRAVVSQVPAIVTVYVYDDHGKSVAQGSGFLLSSDGICVTNFHVIRDALDVDVKLGDGRLYQLLSVQGYDADRDIAVIQLGRKTGNGVEIAADLPFLTLAIDNAQVGDHIATVGSPEGLSNSVTDGIVSAIRPGDGLTLLQISAPISPGSSGGPVFNLKGEVVAITSYQLREGQNLNFAIPADEISHVRSQKANLSLEQIYWQVHTPQRSGEAERTAPRLGYAYGTRSGGTERLTGSFTGSVHNLDSDLRAAFGIFVEQKGQTVLGCMGVRAPLYGSGPLTGSIDGAEVQFDVTSVLFTIHFQGQQQGDHLSGTYQVLVPDAATQYGEFALEKKDGKHLPNNFDSDRDCPTDADMNK